MVQKPRSWAKMARPLCWLHAEKGMTILRAAMLLGQKYQSDDSGGRENHQAGYRGPEKQNAAFVGSAAR